jgi:hypothetical protein
MSHILKHLVSADLFATNPYGGPSDEDSHIDGRVRNIREFVRNLLVSFAMPVIYCFV